MEKGLTNKPRALPKARQRFNQAFGCRVVYQDMKPTNGEFIALIADKLKMDKSA